jgi:tetratricopeptide (TPR) repeat protein
MSVSNCDSRRARGRERRPPNSGWAKGAGVCFSLILLGAILIPAIAFPSFQEAYELYKKGKYYDAEAALLKEKELSPGSVDVYAVLGWCYLNTGRQNMAIDVSLEGLKLNSKDTRLLITLGRSYFELKRYADAVTYLQKSIILNPEYGYTYYYLGRIYLDQGKLALAETALSASIAFMSDKYIFFRYRGEVYERMGNLKAAEADYKKALTLNPNDPGLKQVLIQVINKQTEQESGL